MAIGMNLGVITERDISSELLSRGIRVGAAPPVEPLVTIPPVVTPPASPTQPITVLPRVPTDYYEPYIPIYPPAVVSPEDVTEEEEILPYIPGARVPEEKKGLNKGLLIVIGITAFSLMVLAKPKPTRGVYKRRRF